jgi:hypothetical protein
MKLINPSFLMCMARMSAGYASTSSTHEPNMEMASQWWPEMENVWTPIGWKDHPLRFNILYNGTLVAEPSRYRSWGTGVQLTIVPSAEGLLPQSLTNMAPFALAKTDGGVGQQGWNDTETPVLWTEWQQDGLTVRSQVFGHVAGGGPVRTGEEPLFAWIRLSIEKIETAPRSERCVWTIRINKPHIRREMWRDRNLMVQPEKRVYPIELVPQSSARGFLLVEPDGKNRLGAVRNRNCLVKFLPRPANSSDSFLALELAIKKGAHVDLLVPLLSQEANVFDEEFTLGFDRALAQSERFWSQGLADVARIQTPEPLINQAFRLSPKFAEIVAEKSPLTGEYSLLSGSWVYERLWATPTSMNFTMILDLLGYHSVAEKYLDIFKTHQGTVKPPGRHFQPHPGYLSSPKSLKSVDWLTDHGAILHAICYHGLLTGDSRFIDRWTPTILRACEFIRDARAMTNHGGVEGILPPAVPTDAGRQVQAVWSDGWSYKGLISAVHLLERIGHPRAGEFSREARAYKAAFIEALREAAAWTPQWTNSVGDRHHFTPTALPDGGDLKHPFYLDTGPLFLVYSGLMEADDPLMQSALRYFRDGPNTKTYDLKGNWDQAISLRHEISSCEPCYSWNVFHSHQTGDRVHYLEGMYSLFAGAMSRHTSIGCEHRGGIGGTLFSCCLPIALARLAVIDDQLKPNELHLLRLVPLAWLSADKPTQFERTPTEFGPVNLRFQLRKAGRQLAVSFDARFHNPPKEVLLHIPPLDTIQELVVNGHASKTRSGDVLPVR